MAEFRRKGEKFESEGPILFWGNQLQGGLGLSDGILRGFKFVISPD